MNRKTLPLLPTLLVGLILLLTTGCSIEDLLGLNKRGELRGTAYDGATGGVSRLSGVTVIVGGRQATTDASGNYDLSDLPVGNQELQATKAGYLTHTATVRIQEEGSDDPAANQHSFTMRYEE